MRKRRSNFLTSYIADQYPIETFKDLIFITLDIVENFLLTLESGFDCNSTSISSYSEKYGSFNGNTKSKVETILIKNMDSEEKMIEFLSSYFNAYQSLNNEEKNIFSATFIDKLTDLEIIEKYKTHSVQIRTIRKSAIVRFCLHSGLDKFVDLIKKSSL